MTAMGDRYVNRCESAQWMVAAAGMRSRDIFGRLRLQLRLRGSIPAPAPAPSKAVRRLRLRENCTGSGRSGSGSGSDDQLVIWALNSNTIFKNAKCQDMTSYQGCARLMSRESNLTRLWLKWVESESNHADRHLSQSWVNWILLESKLSHWFSEKKTLRFCIYLQT